MPTCHYTPDEIHRYDQVHAYRNGQIDAFIGAIRGSLDECPAECTVVSLASHLAEERDPGECAELLACALERLAAITPPDIGRRT